MLARLFRTAVTTAIAATAVFIGTGANASMQTTCVTTINGSQVCITAPSVIRGM